MVCKAVDAHYQGIASPSSFSTAGTSAHITTCHREATRNFNKGNKEMGIVMPMTAEQENDIADPKNHNGHNQEEATDIALFVRTSQEDMTGWNRQRIVDALLRETYVDEDTADRISLEIEETISSGKVKTVTGPLATFSVMSVLGCPLHSTN